VCIRLGAVQFEGAQRIAQGGVEDAHVGDVLGSDRMLLGDRRIDVGIHAVSPVLVSKASGPRRCAAACGAADSMMPSSSVPAAKMPLMVR